MKLYNNLVDKYLYGDLDVAEMQRFEQKMDSDYELKNDFLLYSEINKAILEEDVMMLRNKIDTIHKHSERSMLFSLKRLDRRFYYAAASVALLIATGSIVYNTNKPAMDNNAIYNKYFTPYDVSVTYRSGNEEVDLILISALEKYENENYKDAVILFEQVIHKRASDMAANLYSGISLMETEKYKKATNSFQTIITNNNNLFIEQAKWYLALCYIKTNQNNKAIVILNELVSHDSYYKQPAKKVLKDLN
ncbi:MAG: hypothetical protein RBT49_04890 [Bacteroidales bacterium]|jgi:hypothetical protein|nr:hypothetical protein [Bacteroidales bacterium]